MSAKQYLCGPCLKEKCEIDGVVYCRECEAPLCDQCKQDHARIKALKHHKLCDLADVPPKKIQDLLKSLIACPNHKTELAVYLCKDHDTTCCNKCVTADHRKCEEVKVLSDIVQDIKVDCSGLKTVLNDLKQKGESLLEHERKHEKLVSEMENQSLSSLQTIKQKLLDIYAHIENEVLAAITDKKKVIAEQIKNNNEKSRKFLNEIKLQLNTIEHVEKFGTNEHVILMHRKLEKDSLCRLKSTVGELETGRSKSSFTCAEDTSFDRLLIEMKNSVRIDDFTCDVSETGSDTDNSHYKPYTERIPQLQSTKYWSSIPIYDKALTLKLTSCIWIHNYIVISLNFEKALLVIEEDSDFVLSKIKLDSIPWSVSKTGPTDMVITLPFACKIAFAKLRYGNVHITTELTTRVPYDDVTRNAPLNQYICMARDKRQIDILNNDGTFLRRISLSSEIKEWVESYFTLFNFNAYNHTVIMYNSMSNKLMALNLNGEKVFEYEHPHLHEFVARQLAVDPSGNMYLTFCSGNIHQISPSGKYVRSVLNELQDPFVICFNSTFDKFAICSDAETPYLRVYTFN